MKKLKPNKLVLRTETVAHLDLPQLANVQSGNLNAPASDTRTVCTITRTPVNTESC